MLAKEHPKRWWQTMPAILGGLAALIGAITSLLLALGQLGIINGTNPPDSTSDAIDQNTANRNTTTQNVIERSSTERSATERNTAQANSNFRIVEVFLRADPFNYEGPCPVKIVFSGRISVAGGSGTVSYKFLRSDGALAPVQSIHFNEPGSKKITNTWTLGAATPRFQPYSGWQAIQTFDPVESQSQKASFNIHCH